MEISQLEECPLKERRVKKTATVKHQIKNASKPESQ